MTLARVPALGSMLLVLSIMVPTVALSAQTCTIILATVGGGTAAIDSGVASGACGRQVRIRATRLRGYYFTGWGLANASGTSAPGAWPGSLEHVIRPLLTSSTTFTPKFALASPCVRLAALERINWERAKPTTTNPNGLPPLIADRRLTAAADSHSLYMKVANKLTNEQQDSLRFPRYFTGRYPEERIGRQGAALNVTSTILTQTVAAVLASNDGIATAELWLADESLFAAGPGLKQSNRGYLLDGGSSSGHVGVGAVGEFWTLHHMRQPQAVSVDLCASAPSEQVPAQIPITPVGLTAGATSSSLTALSWTDAATTEFAYLIERCAGANCTAFLQIDSIVANATTYQNSGLSASTTYSYRVRATNAVGRSAYSNTATVMTAAAANPPSAPPAPPSSLTAVARCLDSQCSVGSIALTWTDNATDEEGYRIARCAGSGCVDFTNLASVGRSVTGYADASALVGVAHTYRVAACRLSGGCSSPSNSASATISSSRPAAPSALLATTMSRSQINLSWTDNASNETAYRIDRCAGVGCTSFAEIATVGPNITSYHSTGLLAGTRYSYRVRAINGSANSDFSNTVMSVTMP